MKKLLAMVLALVMTLSLAVSANAAFKDVKDIDETYAEAVEVLTGMKVFKGYEDGSFLPKNAITRAEVAAIVYRIYTTDVKDTYVKNYETYNKFADMAGAGWAKGYIGYCANAALVKGYPDGNFKPSGNVTGYEVLAMILRAVGYDQKNEFTGADWALHVAEIAEQNKILKNVKGVDLNAPATRELVSELLFQSIQVPMVSYTAAFGYQNVGLNEKADNKIFAKNETLGSKNFELDRVTGYVTANDYGTKFKNMQIAGKNLAKKDDTVKVADQDIFDAGRYGHVWTSKGSVITDVFYDDSLLATKYESWNVNWTNKDKSDFIAKEGDMNYYLNGKEVKADDIKAALAVKGSEKALYDIDDDGDIDTVIVINPTVDYMEADYVVKGDEVKIQGVKYDKDEVSGYEDFVYLFKCEKETWTSGVGQLYTYYGVTSDGEVKEFESYDESRVGTVCYYFLRNDKTYDFAPAPYETDLVSVELLGDKDTVEYRYEGKNTESNIYSNLDKVYDLTDTSDLKAGDKVDTYDWKWQTTKVVEGMLVIDRKDGDVECLFVLDDDVTFGEFKINGVVNGANYWYPVANYNGTKLVERALADLDGGDFKADKYYHINDADAIKGDAGFKFEAGKTYTVVEHKDIVNDIKAVTGATLKDNVLTVPMDAYVADQAADYIETAGTKKLEGNKLTVTLTSEDGICTKDVVITVKSEKFDVTFTTAKMDAAKGAEVVFTGESDLGNPLNKTLVKSVEIVNKEGTLVYALENVSDLNDSIQAIGTSTLTAGKEYTAVVTLLDGTSYSKTLEAQSGIPSGI